MISFNRIVLVFVVAAVVQANAAIIGFEEDLMDGAFDAPNWVQFAGDGEFVDGGFLMEKNIGFTKYLGRFLATQIWTESSTVKTL
ncbi:MAG: hypothetical protein KDB27_07750 [Planctomycetales bacterium]|nr:hypothetical protein [Planctomycetales bacterium]